MDGFIGEVKYFAGIYAPVNWMFCEGQQLRINQFTPLYSLIGDQFGGDGKNYFNLPDFRGRMALCAGQGTGLTLRKAGETEGHETIQLSTVNMPTHTHQVKSEDNPGRGQAVASPVGNIYSKISTGTVYTANSTNLASMKPDMLSPEGQTGAHENMLPWLSMHFIICVYGYYPIRP